jgi:hypothetical protein
MNRRRLIQTTALALAPFAPAAVRAQTPSSPHQGVPPSVVDKLLKVIAALGVDTILPGPVATALGLTADAQPWPDRQLAVKSADSGVLHAVAIHRGGDPDMVFSVPGPAAVSIFRARRDGALVGATDFFSGTRLTANLPLAQSQADFAAEGAFWAAHVDGLMSQIP